MSDLKTSRIAELDALRGLAALSVLLFHYTTRYQELYGHTESLIFYFDWGQYGVNLFFMISGYVIFMTLDRTKNALDFVVSRVTRLYPAYWVAIFITAAVINFFGYPAEQVSSGQVFANLTMFHWIPHIKSIDGVYWTLQVEMMFYLIMLILYQLRLLEKIDKVLFVWLCLSFIYFSVLFISDFTLPMSRFFIFHHIPFFALGIIFYRIRQHGEIRAPEYRLLAFALSLIIVFSAEWLKVLTLLFCTIFYFLVNGKLKWMTNKGIIFLGTISYPLYLLHQNIGYIVIRYLENKHVVPILSIAIAAVVTFILAIAVTFLIEKPALRLLRTAYKRLITPRLKYEER